MENSGALEVEFEGLDWSDVFCDTPDVMVSDLLEFEQKSCLPTSDLSPAAAATTEAASNPPPDDSVFPWIGGIEDLLMKDDENHDEIEDPQFCTEFFSDVLVDSTPPDTPADHPEAVDDAAYKISSASEDGCLEKRKENGVLDVDNDVNNNTNNSNDGDSLEDEEDPISKKRRRQLRNKDAALRSRERKKVYVKDLEMKSRYLEGECRRLGRLLQCCSAENHVLRLQLQNDKAFGVSMTKQESAVLLLESLLLGSLLWLLGIIWLDPLPTQDQSTLGAIPQESVGSRVVESGSQRRARRMLIPSKCRRCKSSWIKMKWNVDCFLDGAASFLIPLECR